MKRTLFFIFLFATIVASKGNAASAWTQRADLDSMRIAGSTGAAIGYSIYMVTGADSSGCKNKLMCYNMFTNVWTRVLNADFPGALRNCASSFALGGKFYVGLGVGPTSGDGPYADWFCYDPATNAWTPVPFAFPGDPRAYASSVSVGNKGYVIGGMNDMSCMIYADVLEFDPATGWSYKASFTGTPRFGATAFVIADCIYYGTGSYFSGNGYLNDFAKLDLAQNSWTAIDSFPGLPRSGAVAFEIGEDGFVGTGSHGGCDFYNDFFSYNSVTATWTSRDSLSIPRAAAVGVSATGTGFVITGRLNDWSYTPDTWEYTPSVTTDIAAVEQHVSSTVNVFPNPATDQATIPLPDGTYDVSVYDASGKLVFSLSDHGNVTLTRNDIPAAGIYFCTIIRTDAPDKPITTSFIFQ